MADSVYNLDAVTSILRDTSRELIPLIYPEEMPFDSLGSVNTLDGCYNYSEYTENKINSDDYVYINEVNITKTDTRLLNSTNSLARNVYSAFVDFEVIKNRYPRQ